MARTEARFFVAGDTFLGDGSSRLRHGFNYLRGTGGSLYYLQHDQLLEGSEQVHLVVKDQRTGIEIARIPQTRNVDYTIRYQEGRILFKSPVPSIADGGLLSSASLNTRDPSGGDPVFVEVSYEHESDRDGGGVSFGGQLRETFYDKLSVGLGYVQEGRGGELSGDDYQLFGVDAAYRHSTASFAEIEYVRSRSYDSIASLSDDGGLSFGAIQRRTGIDDVGNAFHVRGAAELADVIDSDRPLLQVGGFYQFADEGFYAHRRSLDRGATRFGGNLNWDITAEHAIGARNDSVLTRVDDLELADPQALKTMAQYQSRLYYEYHDAAHRAGVELGHSFSDDYYAEDGYSAYSTLLRYEYFGIQDLRLGVSHEVILSADDPRLYQDAMDHLATSFTLAWQILEDLALEATEKVRWNGENSTRLGVRSQITDTTSTYVQQRFGTQKGGKQFNSTTVVGGEQAFGEDKSGRVFGEYQLDGGIGGERNRAVAGIGKHWELGRGVTLDTAYERTQIFGPSNYGDQSRDVISLGFGLTRYDSIKLGTRFEFRYDQGDASAPQSSPCFSNGSLDTPEFCRDRMLGGFDKYQLVALNSVDWKWTDDLSMLVRYNIAMTRNLTLDALEQIDQELSVGFAFRPVDWDSVNILAKYTYLDSQRPLALEDYTYDRNQKHVVSLVPVFQISSGTQLVTKVAWKHIISDLQSYSGADFGNVVTDLMLFIFRINQEFYKISEELSLELGVEYRFMQLFDPNQFEHGFLLGADVVLFDYARVGFGYNFTSFTDDEYTLESIDQHGWFFRVQGSY
jgi:hypothetical protein